MRGNTRLSVLAIAVSIASGKRKDLVGASCNQCSVIKIGTAYRLLLSSFLIKLHRELSEWQVRGEE